MGRLIIDGNRVYELDEACLQKKKRNGQMPEAIRGAQPQREQEKRMPTRHKA